MFWLPPIVFTVLYVEYWLGEEESSMAGREASTRDREMEDGKKTNVVGGAKIDVYL